MFRLVSEAHRIHLAHLFDPVLAVDASLVDPLPHQITAVYEEMLPRQPLRFLLADDPGASKTIMAGLFMIETLKKLKALALWIRNAGTNTNWLQLASLLNENFTTSISNHSLAEPVIPYGAGKIPPHKPSVHQKLVIFTEHRDTLNYLADRITTLLGRKSAVVTIHGAIGREDRLKIQEPFKHDPEVQVLLATDAAGEGINLQSKLGLSRLWRARQNGSFALCS
jgi:superfamily II DNA/RNA helicase